jgi:uncharacterized protein (DUF302 family)
MNANNGIINQISPYAVTETIDRFAAILQAKGITVFARIDQQAEAEKVGLSLCPTQLLLFGSSDHRNSPHGGRTNDRPGFTPENTGMGSD